ncbi:hypothetical protein [Wenxinia marina]|uniref:Uncharacterized protein n=1 Tax=Wenxinia marina DSM 24838 TaxID=1123501 RepID=A0A0D0QA06_9RHOB|nr:hypothetical protein [Wenxinia marina]KIQ69162.1 hypothetical protein Wenmar_02232 [Wenxinia marina DSM 24838]GGL70883.1 hypothetical protein GCM10011392_26720 [Wenxinia marina]
MTRPALFAATALGLAGAASAQGDRIDLALDYSPAAAARLAALGERVTVAAWWYGEPASADVPVDEIGQVQLASSTTIVDPRPLTVALPAVPDGADVASVLAPRLLDNVYSAREGDPDNILHCDLVEDAVADLAGRTLPVICQLIGE